MTGDETRTLTYAELAQIMGLELASARRLAFRKGWPRTRGNDGLARVRVPVDALARHNGTAPVVITTTVTADTMVATTPAEVAELRERLATAETELRDELRRRAEMAEATAAAATRRAEIAEAAAAEASQRAAEEAQARAMAEVAAAAVTQRAEVAEVAAADARQHGAEATRRAETAEVAAAEATRRAEAAERDALDGWRLALALVRRLVPTGGPR